MWDRLVDHISNRDLRSTIVLAEARARERIALRAPWTIEEVVRACELSQALNRRGALLLSGLAEIVEVNPGAFRPDDRLGDLLRVNRNELDIEAAQILSRDGIGKYVEVFGYRIVDLIQKLSVPSRWGKQMGNLASVPRSEDEWIDMIMEMSICEFLQFFSPALQD